MDQKEINEASNQHGTAQAVGRTQHRIVGPYHLFSFEDEPCPYCGDRVVATATAFHKAPDGWKCDEVDANCESEPDIDSPEWEDWFDGHSRDVYEILEPHSRRLVNRINREYRFALDRPNPKVSGCAAGEAP